MDLTHDLYSFVELPNGEGAMPGYLFHSSAGTVEFVVIEEEMEQLHEYCLLCLDATNSKIEELHNQLIALKHGTENCEHPELGDIGVDAGMGLEEHEIPMWEDAQSFLLIAMCLLLLSVFVEKSLKSLHLAVANASQESVSLNKRTSKVGAYIEFLETTFCHGFKEPSSSLETREKCRVIRNCFAHGDWDRVLVLVQQQSLREAFAAASGLFESIESAYVKWQSDSS